MSPSFLTGIEIWLNFCCAPFSGAPLDSLAAPSTFRSSLTTCGGSLLGYYSSCSSLRFGDASAVFLSLFKGFLGDSSSP